LSVPFNVADDAPFANCTGRDSMALSASAQGLAANSAHAMTKLRKVVTD
jgi:hypothetical protein